MCTDVLLFFHETRIFGAFCPIMFALWVWVGFRASLRDGPLCENWEVG